MEILLDSDINACSEIFPVYYELFTIKIVNKNIQNIKK